MYSHWYWAPGKWRRTALSLLTFFLALLILYVSIHFSSLGSTIQARYQSKNVFKLNSYEIKEGDSLWKIAISNNLSLDSILSCNKLKNAHYIRPKQHISLPNMQGVLYTIQDGDTFADLAKEFDISPEFIIAVNTLPPTITEQALIGHDIFIPGAHYSLDKMLKELGLQFLKPCPGRITSGYGWRIHPITGKRSLHRGIDIAGWYGVPIKACYDGQVVFTGVRGNYGYCIIIRHNSEYSTLYGHCSKIAVNRGAFVSQGDIIGYVGSSGRTTGPHLHFEVRRNGRCVNPFAVMHFE